MTTPQGDRGGVTRREFLALSAASAATLSLTACGGKGSGGGLFNGILQRGVIDYCDSSSSSASSAGKRTKIDDTEVTLPIDWNYAHSKQSDFNGANWSGDDAYRGIGIFNCNEEGDNSPEFASSYIVNMRWEYISYGAEMGGYPAHAAYTGTDEETGITVGGTSASCVSGGGIINSQPTENSAAFAAALRKARIIVFNPETNKACVCGCGFCGLSDDNNPRKQSGNLNWGGAPLALMGGITTAVSEAIGARQNHSVLRLYFANQDAKLGPIDSMGSKMMASGSSGKSNKCKDSTGADNSSIAANAVSLSYDQDNPTFPGHEVVTDIVSGSNRSSRCPTTKAVTEQRKLVCGDQYTADCGYFVATVIRALVDQEAPTGYVRAMVAYYRAHPDLYQRVISGDEGLTCAAIASSRINDLKPGDIFCEAGQGHTFLFVGHEAIQKQYDYITDPDVNAVSASQDEHGPRLQKLRYSDTRTYEVYRFVGTPNPHPAMASKS